MGKCILWIGFSFNSTLPGGGLFCSSPFSLRLFLSLRGQCCEILKLLCLLLLFRILGCSFVSSADFVARSVTDHVLGPEVVHSQTNRYVHITNLFLKPSG